MSANRLLAVVCMLALFGAGCAAPPNETTTVTPPANEAINVTPAATESPMANETTVEMPPPAENVSETPTENRSVYLMSFSLSPRNLTVYVGTSVSFVHYQSQGYPTFVLVSEEGLWENKTMTYGDVFTYTFDQPGVYHYYVKEYGAAMRGEIRVIER